MSDSIAILEAMGLAPHERAVRTMAHELRAPLHEFVVQNGEEGSSILHYDTAHEPIPKEGERASNISFHASLLPSRKELRIRHLKHDGENDMVNSRRSGSEILRGLVSAGKTLQHDIYVDEDISEATLGNPNQTKVDLAALKILERGTTFYNKAGFYPENFQEIYAYNQKKLDKPLSRFYKGKYTPTDLGEELGAEFNGATTIREVGLAIRDKVRPGMPISDDFASALKGLLDKVQFSVNDRNLKHREF